MIGKVGPRGGQVSGLLYYLYGPGRNEAHTDPHLIVGWRHPPNWNRHCARTAITTSGA